MFLAKAMGLGFTVCRPFGENHRFDFLVLGPRRRGWRVQVKSSWVKSNGVYRFRTSGAGRRRYRRWEVDFIVAYVVPEDAWYVIPRRIVRGDVGYVIPQARRGRWERYREAWGLLRGQVPGYGIELQACAAGEPEQHPERCRLSRDPSLGPAPSLRMTGTNGGEEGEE